LRVSGRNDALARKHFGVGDAPGDIMVIKPAIDVDGGREGFHRLGGGALEATTPEFRFPRHLSYLADFCFSMLDSELRP
jgi:hypothetical protein